MQALLLGLLDDLVAVISPISNQVLGFKSFYQCYCMAAISYGSRCSKHLDWHTKRGASTLPDVSWCCAPFCASYAFIAALGPCYMGVHFAMAGIDHELFKARLFDESLKQLFPDTLVSPANKAPMGIASAAIAIGQISPRRFRAQYPEDGVDEVAIVLRLFAPGSCTSGHVGFQNPPDMFGESVVVMGGFVQGGRGLEKDVSSLHRLVTTLYEAFFQTSRSNFKSYFSRVIANSVASGKHVKIVPTVISNR